MQINIMSKKPSGCEYRKRKKDEQDKAKKHQKINVFFKSTSEMSLIVAKDASTSSCVSKCNVSDVTIGNKCSYTSEQEQIPYPAPAQPSAAASTSGLDNKAKVDVSLDDKINYSASLKKRRGFKSV